MENPREPAGYIAQRAYQWDSNAGDWEFSPTPGATALVIRQVTGGAFYSSEDVRLNRDGNDLRIHLPEGLHRLLLKGWYENPAAWRVDDIQFRNGASAEAVDYGSFRRKELSYDETEYLPDRARLFDLMRRAAQISAPAEGDGTTVHPEEKTSAASPPASAASGVRDDDEVKLVLGTSDDDNLTMDAGVHTAKARGGDDTIHVQHLSPAADRLDNKHVLGGHGNDTADYRGAFKEPKAGIEVSLAKQTVKWGAGGVDQLASIENIGGTDAADRLEGSKKDNVLTGYRGDDWYRVRLGGGNDTIVDEDSTAGNIDTLAFGKGIQLEQLSRYRNGDDVVIDIHRVDGAFDGRVTIRNGHQADFEIETFLLSSGESYQLIDIAVSSTAVL
ncbi:hypothetical protein [Roseateles noduli]|uniref:hypothetical protein n=1 Tax=Roseateles noduli TaxID=2052484 RepID=UPI003D65F06C